jgi:cytoskeletal protein CcmA (bactofilin family)
MAENQTNQEFPTILGPDASFKGEFVVREGHAVMGRLEGKVTTPGRIHVTKEAKMAADVDAGGIVVEGEVHGNLSANDRIELKNSARYEGDLRASKLVVDEGRDLQRARQRRPRRGQERPEGPAAVWT